MCGQSAPSLPGGESVRPFLLQPEKWQITIHTHTRMGTGFHFTAVLVMAHCPALIAEIEMVRSISSSLQPAGASVVCVSRAP